MDEMTKQKYYYLKSNVLAIKDKHRKLEDSYDVLRSSMKRSLLIDDKIINEDKMDTIGDRCACNVNEIKNIVIPKINTKL